MLKHSSTCNVRNLGLNWPSLCPEYLCTALKFECECKFLFVYECSNLILSPQRIGSPVRHGLSLRSASLIASVPIFWGQVWISFRLNYFTKQLFPSVTLYLVGCSKDLKSIKAASKVLSLNWSWSRIIQFAIYISFPWKA